MNERITLMACGLILAGGVSEAQESAAPQATAAQAVVAYQAIQPRPGTGYTPYAYPAQGSGCSAEGCFNPHRYYCTGETYRKSWFRKWMGTQLGQRSMLDDYPCKCVRPVVVPRTYLRAVRPAVGAADIPATPPAARVRVEPVGPLPPPTR